MPNPHIHQHEYEPVSTVEEAFEYHMRINSQLLVITTKGETIKDILLQEREELNDTEKELV